MAPEELPFSRPSYRIETVFSRLVERFQAKQVWARDIWHLQVHFFVPYLSAPVSQGYVAIKQVFDCHP